MSTRLNASRYVHRNWPAIHAATPNPKKAQNARLRRGGWITFARTHTAANMAASEIATSPNLVSPGLGGIAIAQTVNVPQNASHVPMTIQLRFGGRDAKSV